MNSLSHGSILYVFGVSVCQSACAQPTWQLAIESGLLNITQAVTHDLQGNCILYVYGSGLFAMFYAVAQDLAVLMVILAE